MKYTLTAYLPDGEILEIRSIVGREEAENMADVLVKVTTELEGLPPRRDNNVWYVQSPNWERNGRVLCVLEPVEGTQLTHFERFETASEKTGKTVLYELRRNRQFAAAAWAEGVHLGHATIPPDAWRHLLKTEYLPEVYQLTQAELDELRGLWTDFESVRGTH